MDFERSLCVESGPRVIAKVNRYCSGGKGFTVSKRVCSCVFSAERFIVPFVADFEECGTAAAKTIAAAMAWK
jgi:hypothetical protein